MNSITDALHLERGWRQGDLEMSRSNYNLLVGGLLLYGFVINGLICYLLRDFVNYLSEAMLVGMIVLYLLCVVLSVVLSHSRSAVVNFIGYNLLVLPIGVMLSLAMAAVSFDVIFSALVGTGVFVVAMVAVSYAKPDFFLSLGPVLGIALIVTIIAEIVLRLLGFGVGFTDYAVIAIFTLYLGYDWQRANLCAPTVRNAVLSTTQIYLDIINIFIRLLSIISRSRRR